MRLIDSETVKEYLKRVIWGADTKIDKWVEAMPTIDAIPVEWMVDRANDPERAPLYRRYAQMLYEEWQKEQEANQ